MGGKSGSRLSFFAKGPTLAAFSLIWIVFCLLLSNYILSFFMSLMKFIQPILKGGEINLEKYHFPPFSEIFVFRYQYWGVYTVLYAVALIGLIKFIYNMVVNYRELNNGQYGTSEFEDPKNLKKQYKVIPGSKKEYEGESGAIISANRTRTGKYELMIDTGPVHTMLIGITRSGKGETWVVPMIDVISRAKQKDSMVVNDPKGELAAASYDTLIRRGYDVFVFNLMNTEMSMSFNPLQLVIDSLKEDNPSVAEKYAYSVAFSLYDDPNAKDPFWSNSAKSLVTAIILAIATDCIKAGMEEKVNMYSVANFLASYGSKNDCGDDGEQNALDLFFKARGDSDPASTWYATSNFAAGNTRSSIFSTAMDKLQIFASVPNAKLTSQNSLNLTDIGFGKKPVAVFMVTPDYDRSNHVLASIFTSQLYRVNAEKASKSPNGKMNRRVHMLLDEFGNMPPIEGMASMVTVGAGRGFRIHLVIQSYAQIKNLYGDDSETIIGNCSNQIYILTEDKETAELYSALLGTKTITDYGRSGRFLSLEKTENENTKERALLMPDELMNNMLEGESVVIRANKRQDNKRRKIKPKPIYNRGNNAAKFRWEYLSDDFDTSNSVLNLPIIGDHVNVNLEDISFASAGTGDVHSPLVDCLSRKSLAIVQSKAIEIAQSSLDFKEEYPLPNGEWTAYQMFSFLTYSPFPLGKIEESKINRENLMKIIQKEAKISTAELDKWVDKLEENVEFYKQEVKTLTAKERFAKQLSTQW